jgi:hypothetical protein
VSARKAVIFSILAVAAVALMAPRESQRNSLSFRVTGMDFSQKRPMAWVAVTNDGPTAMKWGFGGGWIEVETGDSSLVSDLHFCGIMEPGAGEVLRIYLPLEAQRWRIRLVVSQASARERVSFKLRQHWDGKLRWVGRKLLPNGQEPSQTICSPMFNAENFVQAANDSDAVNSESQLARITETGL